MRAQFRLSSRVFFPHVAAMPLAWNEIRHRAIKFAHDWSAATSESSDKQTFWNEFFDVFGVAPSVGCPVPLLCVPALPPPLCKANCIHMTPRGMPARTDHFFSRE